MLHPHKTQENVAPPPPLSKLDRKRLTLYLEDCREDPRALAKAIGLDYLATLDWLASPPIQRYLKLHDQFQKRAQTAARRHAEEAAAPVRALCVRALATSLDRALRDPRSQSSLRQAATALFRALDKPSPVGMSTGGQPLSPPSTEGPPTDSPTHAGDEPTPPSSSVSSSTANPRVSSPSPQAPATPEERSEAQPRVSPAPNASSPTSPAPPEARRETHPRVSASPPANPPFPLPNTPAATLLRRAGAA